MKAYIFVTFGLHIDISDFDIKQELVMVNLLCRVHKCTLTVKQEDVLKIILVLLFQLVSQASGNILYVSKFHGFNGNNTCKNVTKPCKTLNHVIDMSIGNDVIKLDAFNTATVPYNKCPTTTKIVTGKLIFYSWNGTATINCSGNALSFEDNSSHSTTVEFNHLKFLDTFLEIKQVSLIVNNCSLGSFKNGTKFDNLIDVLVTNTTTKGNLRINITSTIFLENNNAGSLSVVNHQSFPVFAEMSNITIFKNYLKKTKYVISMKGYVNFNFMNSEISNTKFLGKIPVALVVFSNCLNDRTFGKQNGRHSIKKRASPSFDTLSSVITFSLREINFFSNDATIVSTSFCAAAYVNIIKTTFFSNTGPAAQFASSLVFIASMAKKLRVVLNNCSFVKNNLTTLQYMVMVTVKDFSNDTTLFITQCSFSQNIGSGVFFSYESPRGRSNTGLLKSYCAAQICNNSTLESTEAEDDFEPRVDQSSLQYEETYNLDLVFEDCEFRNNTGSLSSISVMNLTSRIINPLHIKRCVFVGNMGYESGGIWTYDFGIIISDSTFYHNTGKSGAGAISAKGGTMQIENCTLDSNSGGNTKLTQATGTMSLFGGGSVFIQNSRIFQRNTTQIVLNLGTFHSALGISTDSFGNVSLFNSTLDYSWSPSLEKVIIIQLAHTKNFALKEGTSIKCPSGYKIKDSKKLGINPDKTPTLQNFECELCAPGSYTIDRGVYRNNSSHSVKCLLCPYGGRCVKGLQVLPNFWGYKIQMDPPTIQFSRCPIGYCCEPTPSQKSCFPYNICKSGRHGRLCGACKPGYTETLFTTSCRKSEKCKDYWFYPIAAIFVLIFSLYLIIQPDIPGFLYRNISWFRPKPPQVTEIRATNDLSEEIQVSYLNSDDSRTEDVSKNTTNSLERIVFFYYQAIDILSVQGSYNATWDSHLTQFTLGLFNFDIRLNKEGFACPFPGLKPVSKLLFHTLGVFSVLFAIPCIFLLDNAVSVCFSNRTPKIGLYLSAFLKSVFLGYTVLAKKSLTLLQCVTVDGVNCLFVDCNIECYTWWQTLIGTLVLIYFFPFVVVLFFGAKKLYKKQISVVHFFLACLFPLPFLSYWFLHRRHLRNEIVADASGRTAVTSILIGSYRVPDHVSNGTIYWESVLIGRMLLLILAAVLIKEPFLKSFTFVLLCIINLSVHIFFHPYERAFDNYAETISLFCLVLMAMFNLPFMAYLSEGVVPSSPMSHMMNIFSWCQVVLVGFLPFVCVLLVLLAFVSQAVRLVFYLTKGLRLAFTCSSSCRFVGRRRHQDERGDPLIG